MSQNVIQLSSPLLLTQLLMYLKKEDPPVWEGYALAAAFAVVPMVGGWFNQYSMKVRSIRGPALAPLNSPLCTARAGSGFDIRVTLDAAERSMRSATPVTQPS